MANWIKKIIKKMKHPWKNKETKCNKPGSLLLLTEKNIPVCEGEGTNKCCDDLKTKKDCYENYLKCNAQKYSKYFKEAIESCEVKNLAIVGAYGTGKSTIFKSYLRNGNYKNNYVEVEIGQYFKNSKNKVDKYKPENLNNYIQKQIIIQLSSQIKQRKLNSSFGYKLEKFRDFHWTFYFILFFLFLSIAALLYGFTFIIKKYFKTNTTSFSSTELIFLGFFTFLLILFFFWLFTKMFKLSIKNITFSIFSQKLELELSKQGAISEIDFNISEIVYLFKKLVDKSKYIIVFEDLDRFENVFIFQKLKELNKVINNFLENNPPNWWEKCFKKGINTKLTRKIIFVYLTKNQIFKNQIFKNENKQTKFFDLIIPIVPVISQSKASEVWECEFNKITNKPNSTNENIKNYFVIISQWVYDFREIYNILNQYKIYYDIFNSNCYKSDSNTYYNSDYQLLSFIIFKNIFYKVSESIWKKISNQMIMKTWARSLDIHDFIWRGFDNMQFLNKFIIFERKEDLISALKKPKELLILNSKEVDIYYLLNYMFNFLRKKNLFSYFSGNFHYKYKDNSINVFEQHFLEHIFTEKKISSDFFKSHNTRWNKNQTDNKVNSNNIEHNNGQKEPKYKKFIKELKNKGFPFSELDIFHYSSLHKNDYKSINEIDTINSNEIDKNKSSLEYMFDALKIKFEERINKQEKSNEKYELEEIYKSHFQYITHWEDEMSSNIDLTNIFLKLVDYDYADNLISDDFSIKKHSLSQWFINLIIENGKALSSLFHNIFWISTPIGQLLLLVILIKINTEDIEPRFFIEKLELIKGSNIKKSYIDQLTTFTLEYYKNFGLSNDMLDALEILKDLIDWI